MMRRSLFVVLLLATVAPSAPSQEGGVLVRPANADLADQFQLDAEGDATLAPRILLLGQGDYELRRVAANSFLPNRVYGIYHRGQKAWAFVVTNGHGKLPKPMEVLAPDTVLPGSFLGAANPYEFFELTEQFRWRATKKPEVRYFLLPSRPGFVKRERFYVPPSGR